MLVSNCLRNSSLTIIWNNLGLSNYKRMKGILNSEKKMPLIIKKGIIETLIQKMNILLNVYKKMFL